MESLTLRPTSASGTNWSKIAKAYDGDTTTSATVKTTSDTYTNRAGTFTFDTSAIPSVATINSATLHVNCKSSSGSRTKLYADINGNSSSRVIDVAIGKSQADKTADIADYIRSLNTIKLMQYNSKSSSYTFTLYEIFIDNTVNKYPYVERLKYEVSKNGMIKAMEYLSVSDEIFENSEFFYEYWHWFFRHCRKLASRKNGE